MGISGTIFNCENFSGSYSSYFTNDYNLTLTSSTI